VSLSMQLVTPVNLWASYSQAQASGGGGASLIENEGSAWWVLLCTC
jgi:hypothetical protein